MKTKTKIINLLGGPGVGKSTSATGVFSRLKQVGIRVEYVSEYAKDLTWIGAINLLNNQIHVFGEQFTRQYSLIDQVDYVITDSPLLLSSMYYEYYFEKSNQSLFSPEYKKMAIEFYDRTALEFNNINFYISRKKEYIKMGRNQSEYEAVDIDRQIQKKLKDLNIDYYETNSQDAIEDIIKVIKKDISPQE